MNNETNNDNTIDMQAMNKYVPTIINSANEITNKYPNSATCNKFNFAGDIYDAKVVEVYDGDTITVLFDPFPNSIYSKFYKFKIRMNGYNSAEIKPLLTCPNRQDVVSLAYVARDALREKILNKEIKLFCHDFDKYGRILGDIYLNENGTDLHINQWMLDNNYGKVYNGHGEKLF